MQTCKIGDVVAWNDVPNGAMVRDVSGDLAVRQTRGRTSFGSWVWSADDPRWIRWCGVWQWWIHEHVGEVTIVALDVPIDATAEHLRELAERQPDLGAERVAGDAPHHGYVNTDAAHMPEGLDERLRWDARLRQLGERDES